MVMTWAHPFACLVGGVEALTLVLAVGAERGWGGARGGACLALFVLLLMVLPRGPPMARIPQDPVRFGLGHLADVRLSLVAQDDPALE